MDIKATYTTIPDLHTNSVFEIQKVYTINITIFEESTKVTLQYAYLNEELKQLEVAVNDLIQLPFHKTYVYSYEVDLQETNHVLCRYLDGSIHPFPHKFLETYVGKRFLLHPKDKLGIPWNRKIEVLFEYGLE